MEITSHSLAAVLGLTRYFTGKPCKNGHVAERYMNRQCVECRTEVESPQQVHLRKTRAAQKRYYQRHIEVIRKKQSEYNKANYERKYAYNKSWRKLNQERVRATLRARYQADPAKSRAKSASYRALKLRATPPWLTEDHYAQIGEIYSMAVNLSKETGIPHEVDHFVPIAGKNVCGLHVPWNLRPIPRSDNRSKSNKLIDTTD